MNFDRAASPEAPRPGRVAVILAALAFAFALAACGPADHSGSDESPSGTSSSAAESAPPGAERPTTAGGVGLRYDDLPTPLPNSTSLPPAPPTIRFRDVTDTSGITFIQRSGDDENKHFPTANGSGVAMLDYDGDGHLDLYLLTTRNLPLDAPTESQGNRLYRNKGDATFEDVTDAAGVGYQGFTHGAAVGDIDNDGHPDLFLATLGANVLYRNNGDGTFTDVSDALGPDGPRWSSAGAFLDYDNDGHLDLYVSCYGLWDIHDNEFCGDKERGVRVYCTPQVITTARHYLYRNRGDGTFEDATASAGILRDDGRGMGIVAADLDDNGWIDLYVGNDLTPNFLFLNQGDGTFDDISEFSGAAASEAGIYQAGMGVDAEDVDGDGRVDLFVTNFRNDYNTLYRNLGQGNFQDVSAGAGIARSSFTEVGWGCALADFDLDGWPDMLVVNGHVDSNLPLIGIDEAQEEPSKVWRNMGDGKFAQVMDPGPWFAVPHVARGAAFGDLDNDGDIDVVVSLLDTKPAVLLNESDAGGWIGFDLVGISSNRSAVGAKVELTLLDGRRLRRQVKGGGSYFSTNDPRLVFGLGTAGEVVSAVIRWPSGTTQTIDGPEVGRYHRIEEPGEAPGASTALLGGAP